MCACLFLCLFVCVCVCVCLCVCACLWLCVCMVLCICLCEYVYEYGCMYVCACGWVCLFVCVLHFQKTVYLLFISSTLTPQEDNKLATELMFEFSSYPPILWKEAYSKTCANYSEKWPSKGHKHCHSRLGIPEKIEEYFKPQKRMSQRKQERTYAGKILKVLEISTLVVI